MRSVVFDIETSDLAAVGAGVLLCAVVKPLGKREVVFRADRYKMTWGHEWKLVRDVIESLADYDLWIGHNLEKFDIPWLKSRALFFSLQDFPQPYTYDTVKAFRRLGYKTAPNHFGRPSASLAHVVDFFGLPQEKTHIYPRAHWETVWGDKERRADAMGELVRHCVADVLMTERVHHELFPRDRKAILRRVL